MRFVDADALKTKCGEWYTEEGTEEGFIGTLGSLLDAAPTVDAIPVEWLREKIKEHTNDEGWQDYLANSFGLCIEKWQKKQEAQDGEV